MRQFKRILVGVDLSRGDRLASSELGEPTRHAMTRARWLASHAGAELIFFSALEISPQAEELLHEDEGQRRTVEDAANEVLSELVNQAKAEGINARSELVFGRSWMEIIRAVLREQVDLVVIGTRELGATGRLLFGSTAMKLLRKCPCPVLVSRPDPEIKDLNILVPSDFSEVSSRALELGVAAGQLTDSRLVLLHCLDDHVDQRIRLTGMPEEQVEAYKKQAIDEAEGRLREQLAPIDYRTVSGGTQVVVRRGPAEVEIVQVIEEYEIDLLVMGTIARSGIPGMFIGNTAERLLPDVRCSLLAIKPEGFVSPVTLN
ncbi:MAG: universal stress protein [Planctomycetaceae bacterium]|nr:universal stress protein [Planctomycetaceae bacterium]